MTDESDSPKRALVDVDGTLCRNLPRVCEHVEVEYGLEISPEQITEWSYTFEEIGEEIEDVFDHLLSERPEWYLSELSPMEGARRGLRELKANGYEIWIVTHRPAETHHITEAWMDGHGLQYDRFVEQVPENKGDVPGDVLVDDYHGHVRDAVRKGKRGILIDHPYNRAPDHHRADVAESWREVADLLSEQ
jgi:uncharacterized HAD superfamily protein